MQHFSVSFKTMYQSEEGLARTSNSYHEIKIDIIYFPYIFTYMFLFACHSKENIFTLRTVLIVS